MSKRVVRSSSSSSSSSSSLVFSAALLSLPLLTLLLRRAQGFIPLSEPSRFISHPKRHHEQLLLFASSSSSSSTPSSSSSSSSLLDLPEIESMRAGQIKQELESYGISTKSFLEKSELIQALQQARAQGLQPTTTTTTTSKQPQAQTSTTTTTATNKSSTTNTATSTTSTSSDRASPNKKEPSLLAQEIAQCQTMTTAQLKQELRERGISTKSFLEKSEFVRALAEARVKNPTMNNNEEGYAEYKNVEVLTDDSAGPRKKQQQQQQQQQQTSNPFNPFGAGGGGGANPFGAGANPFGAGANPFGGAAGAGANPFGGGMGGMGGIADMLKNMGMGGGVAGSGGNPFGSGMGGGGGGFGGGAGVGGGMGDVMGKAQELMKNPKVRELMQRAQSSPSLMAKVNECMTNPLSFAKYQNDPEVAELVRELKKYV